MQRKYYHLNPLMYLALEGHSLSLEVLEIKTPRLQALVLMIILETSLSLSEAAHSCLFPDGVLPALETRCFRWMPFIFGILSFLDWQNLNLLAFHKACSKVCLFN